MAQQAQPISDLDNTGSWTSTPLWSKIEEGGGGDGTVVVSDTTPVVTEPFTVDLSTITDPAKSTGHDLKIRWAKNSGGGGNKTIRIELRMGYVNESTLGTLIATDDYAINSTTLRTDSTTMSGAEADAITDYSDLQIRVMGVASNRALKVDFVELEIIDEISFDQVDFRIRPSDADPAINANAGADWDQAIDVNASMEPDLLFRIRFGINSASLGITEGFQLRSQKNGTGGYTLIPNNGDPFIGGGDAQREIMCIPGSYTDGAATTDLLNPTGSFVAGNGNDDNTTATIVFAIGEHTEIEFCILIRKMSNDGHVPDTDFFEFRVYKDDGTALDTYTVTPRVDVELRDDHIGGTWIETSGHTMRVDDEGNLYALIEQAETGAGIVLRMMKSADGGHSWNLMDAAGSPTHTDIETADMDYDPGGDIMHISIQGPNTDDVKYLTFRVAGHASPDTWNIDQAVTTIGTVGLQCVAIVNRAVDSKVFLFYQFNQSGGREQIEYKVLSGGTWGTGVSLDTEASTDIQHAQAIIDSGDKIHIIYHTANGTVGELFYKTIASGGETLSSRTQVDQSITVDAGAPGNRSGTHTPLVLWDDGATEKVGVLYVNDVGDIVNWNESATSTPGWANEAVVSTGQVRTGALGSDQIGATTIVDDVDDEPWAFWIDDEVATDQYRMLEDTEVSGSWGTDTERDDGVFSGMRAITFTHSSGNGGARVIGLFVSDQLNSTSPSNGGPVTTTGNTGFIRYMEIILAGGANVYPPFPRRQRRSVRM